jgi:hypothetical protein
MTTTSHPMPRRACATPELGPLPQHGRGHAEVGHRDFMYACIASAFSGIATSASAVRRVSANFLDMTITSSRASTRAGP